MIQANLMVKAGRARLCVWCSVSTDLSLGHRLVFLRIDINDVQPEVEQAHDHKDLRAYYEAGTAQTAL